MDSLGIKDMDKQQLIKKILDTICEQFEILDGIDGYKEFRENIASSQDSNLVDAHDAVVTAAYEICMGRGFEKK